MFMKTILTGLVLLGCVMVPIVGSSTRKENSYVSTIYTRKETAFTLETLTIYNPTRRQCDRTPLITASNKKIDLAKLSSQQLRWIALSRNLLKRWNGAFAYGDTVLVTSGDPAIDGAWVIHDTLNKRYKNRGDLLFDRSVRKLGKWENVTISKM
jgi:hypothetical protein